MTCCPSRSARRWRRLAVFAGGWTLEAAEAVIGPEALELLARLVDKSLVQAEELDGATRYRLLETMRQYARDRLLDAPRGDATAARDRHLAYYLDWAIRLEADLFGRKMAQALSQYETELDNIRAALEWAETRDPELALKLVTATGPSGNRAYNTEWRQRLTTLLPLFEALPPVTGEAARQRTALRASAVFLLGFWLLTRVENDTAEGLLQASVVTAREAGVPRVAINALQVLATSYLFFGDLDAGEAAIKQAEDLLAQTDYPIGWVFFQMHRATLARLRGDFGGAAHNLDQALAGARANGNPWVAGVALLNAGMMAKAQQDYARANTHFNEARQLFAGIGDSHFAEVLHSELGHVARAEQRYADALAWYVQSVAGWQAIGHLGAAAHDLECLGLIAVELNQAPTAARILGAAQAARESSQAQMTPMEREEYDAHLVRLRAQLTAAELDFDLGRRAQPVH